MKQKKYFKDFNLILLLLTFLISPILILCQEEGNPKLTEVWDPVPPIVKPGENNLPPSDAIILFDGTNLNEWENVKGGEAKWQLGEGAMTVVKKAGSIRTKKSFGDCQLHIEWRTPKKLKAMDKDVETAEYFYKIDMKFKFLILTIT